MYSKFIASILFFFVFSIAQAQKDFHLGVTASFSTPFIINQNNFGTLDGFNNEFARTSELDYRVALGGTFGVSMGYNFTEKYGLQWELLIDKLGQKYDGIVKQDIGATNYDVLVKRQLNLIYVNFPLLFKFEGKNVLGVGKKKLKYYLTAGPQIGALLSVYEVVEIADATIPNNKGNIQEREKFRNLDFGLAVNNGILFYWQRNMYFNASFNLYFGLLDINGKTIRDLEYFSNNDVSYKPSHNFRPAINVGYHYIFTTRRFY